jgi:hypothetical protein
LREAAVALVRLGCGHDSGPSIGVSSNLGVSRRRVPPFATSSAGGQHDPRSARRSHGRVNGMALVTRLAKLAITYRAAGPPRDPHPDRMFIGHAAVTRARPALARSRRYLRSSSAGALETVPTLLQRWRARGRARGRERHPPGRAWPS